MTELRRVYISKWWRTKGVVVGRLERTSDREDCVVYVPSNNDIDMLVHLPKQHVHRSLAEAIDACIDARDKEWMRTNVLCERLARTCYDDNGVMFVRSKRTEA